MSGWKPGDLATTPDGDLWLYGPAIMGPDRWSTPGVDGDFSTNEVETDYGPLQRAYVVGEDQIDAAADRARRAWYRGWRTQQCPFAELPEDAQECWRRVALAVLDARG